MSNPYHGGLDLRKHTDYSGTKEFKIHIEHLNGISFIGVFHTNKKCKSVTFNTGSGALRHPRCTGCDKLITKDIIRKAKLLRDAEDCLVS
jgi:hypothetical protein